MADDELLDYYDFAGGRLGSTSRRAVHDRGLWHRTLHLWLASADHGGSLLFQLRSPTASNWPGLLDVSVAGHLLAGEDYVDGLRESREEIGIEVPPAAVTPLGLRRDESVDPGGGRNRELQGVYIARLDPAWGRFDAVDHEAAGLFWISNREGDRLHRGERATIICPGVTIEGGITREVRRPISLDDFVPRADGYYVRMHEIAAKLLRGDPLPQLDDPTGPTVSI